ncbi:ribosome-associated translation inhibitor RaiA [Candidatus Peregrinibacteria bacterium]|nr:ribosome-associated translation inhibitor RaiA [Candidatus Peregrinibacteria bacterium]
MQINFHQKHIHLSDAQKDYAQSKIEGLARFKVMEDESVVVKVDVEYREHIASDKKILMAVNVHIPGEALRAETDCVSIEEGIDLIEPKLASQLEKNKTAKQG